MRTGSRLALAVASGWLAVSVGVGASGPISPDAAAIQVQLGGALFAEGRYREALDAYQRAAGVDDARLVQRVRAGIVQAALRVAEFRLASESANILERIAPDQPETLALSGDARWAMGLFDEAETAYQALLTIDPANPRARRGMARALASRSRLDEALVEARAAVAGAPSDAEMHNTLSFVLERLRRYEEAAQAMANCLNLLPNREAGEQATWARAEVKFLRSFGDRPPYEMAPADRLRRHTVPFKVDHEKVIVKVRLNGSRDDVDFVLDTGAENTAISRRTAQRFSVEPTMTTLTAGVGDVGVRGLQVGRLDSLEIGSFRVKNLPVIIKNPPLSALPTREPEGFSPLALGLSMSVDYQRKQLTIGPGSSEGPFDLELPLRMHRLATVRGLVDETHAVNFVVDTGGEVISISTATARSLTKIRDSRRIWLKVYGTSGWERDAYLLPGVNLAFESIRMANTPVVVLNLGAPSALLGYQLGGIVGHTFLKKYRFDIDLEKSRLRLKRL